MPTLELSNAQARRYLLRRNLLAPPRSLPPQPESVLAVMDRLALLQFDPLEVPGARNHDLVLHARISQYRRQWADQWLYGPDRRFIELYNKSLNIVPLAELPFYRLTWDRNEGAQRDGILRQQAAVAEAVVERIRAEGPLSTAAFSEHGHAVDWWWAPTRAGRAVMEALFVSGRLGIARRDGNRRYYDLIERLVPEELLGRREPEEDALRHRLLSRFRAAGLTKPSSSEVMYGTGSTADKRRRTAELTEAGLIVEAAVEGLRGPHYLPADEVDLLGDDTPVPPAVTFLAPLDPLMWDRRQLRELWGFQYLWEVYVPEAKRRWGYYVLPILFGDRIVGRFEPRLKRSTRTLRILGINWEDGFAPREAEGFVANMREALRDYRLFVGARRVEWSPGFEAAGRLFGRGG
ncbi:crosslink repair DNA glycosylase YcaQ family protein [soil metagenome]